MGSVGDRPSQVSFARTMALNRSLSSLKRLSISEQSVIWSHLLAWWGKLQSSLETSRRWEPFNGDGGGQQLSLQEAGREHNRQLQKPCRKNHGSHWPVTTAY